MYAMRVVYDLQGVLPLLRVLTRKKSRLNAWPYGQYVLELPSSLPRLLNFRHCWR